MLPVLVFEPEKEDREELCMQIKDYTLHHESDMNFLAGTESVQEADRYLDSESGMMLLFLGLIEDKGEERRGAVQLGKKALKKNRDTYTLYCLHNPSDVMALLNTGVRPAGVLMYPMEKARLEKQLVRIEKDFSELREEEDGDCLVVESGSTTYRVPYSRIQYIEALDKKLTICTDRQSITVRMTLGALEEPLSEHSFVRCHRSVLVNSAFIEHVDYTEMQLYLKNGDTLPVSRGAKDKLREILK